VGLPALITLFGASASLAAIQFLRLQPRFVWVEGGGMTFYWQWLATLPLFGAAGAYLSQRAEGGSVTRLLAGLSPAIILLICDVTEPALGAGDRRFPSSGWWPSDWA
jgi:hypothetical protein